MCIEQLRVYHCYDDMSPRFAYTHCHSYNGYDEGQCPNYRAWDAQTPVNRYRAGRDCPECVAYNASQRQQTRQRQSGGGARRA
ncbi:hypothetical protein VTL71DRAFT_2089 [Oculimacula yallundae]|uniref:Uncharacterized protein n=1 Tax=Oculimacula yallundae TaxID=86028 RepID=A0ABR4C7W1_9HELO